MTDWEGIRHTKLRRWFENWLPALTNPADLATVMEEGEDFAYLTTQPGTDRIGILAQRLASQEAVVMVLAAPALRVFWQERLADAGVAAFDVQSFYRAARWDEAERRRQLEGVEILVVEPGVGDQTVAARKLYKLANEFRGQTISVAFFLMGNGMPPREASTALRIPDWPRRFATKVVWEPRPNLDRLKEAASVLSKGLVPHVDINESAERAGNPMTANVRHHGRSAA